MNTPLDLLSHNILCILQESTGIDVTLDLKNVVIIIYDSLKKDVSFGFC